jgi:hypothetical protein
VVFRLCFSGAEALRHIFPLAISEKSRLNSAALLPITKSRFLSQPLSA